MIISLEDINLPHQIGRYIASQVPHLDEDKGGKGETWAVHRAYFGLGPTAIWNQTTQGIFLKVAKGNSKPVSMYTRGGEWIVLGPGIGSFDQIFAVIQKTLLLKEVESLKTEKESVYAVTSWENCPLPEATLAQKKDFIPIAKVVNMYNEFKNQKT